MKTLLELAFRRLLILILIVLLAYMFYNAIKSPYALDFPRLAQMGVPLALLCIIFAGYPRFESTSARRPLRVMSWVFLALSFAGIFVASLSK